MQKNNDTIAQAGDGVEKPVDEYAIINGMCYTYRHDFGLLDEPEKLGIRTTMAQIFHHDIKPHLAATSPKQSDIAKRLAGALKAAYWYINATEIELEASGHSRSHYLREFHRLCPNLEALAAFEKQKGRG